MRWIVLAVMAATAPLAARAAGDIESGRDVALKSCSLCHVVGDANRLGGIGSTPSFFLMARKIDDYMPRIQSFKERRPHKGLIDRFDDVDRDATDDLLAYIRSLPAD